MTAEIGMLRARTFAMQHQLVAQRPVPYADFGGPDSALCPLEVKGDTSLPNLLYVFGGMLSHVGVPRAEFGRTFREANSQIVFVKDFYQCWYKRGLIGVSEDIQQTADYLRAMMPHDGRTVGTTGISSGGYGAILFGVLMNVSRVVAFSPQTILNRAGWKIFGSPDTSGADFDPESPYNDLKAIIEQAEFTGTIDLYYGDKHKQDVMAAEHLADLPCVRTFPVPIADHGTANWLKRQGKLDNALEPLFRE